jgi:hypothetical protein
MEQHVGVGIDEAGQERGAGQVDDLGTLRGGDLGGGARGDDALPAHEDDPALLGLRGHAIEDTGGTQEEGGLRGRERGSSQETGDEQKEESHGG